MMRLLKTTGALALLCGLAGCAAIPPLPSRGNSGPAAFQAVELPAGTGLNIADVAGNVMFDITSKRGIGKLEIERLAAAPVTAAFRLHLKGLEQFTLAWDEQTVTVNYPSAGAPLATPDPADPLAMPVTVEAGGATIPLESGYFVITAPAQFITDAPERFTVQWVDFYR